MHCKPRLLSDGMVQFDLTISSYCSLQEVLDPIISSYLSILIQVEGAKRVELQTKPRRMHGLQLARGSLSKLKEMRGS